MVDFIDPNFTLHGSSLQALIRLREQLENPTKLMKKLGAMVLGASMDAFRLQRFGDIPWKERYPGQDGPKLNIAGALKDFSDGRKAPKPIRFFDRPALIDEGRRGGLQGSITYKVIDPLSFQVGTVKPYAAKHQYGGNSSQPISKQAKENLRTWLKKTSHSIGKGKKVKPSEYDSKLRPLLKKRVLHTRITARPFIGIHQELWGDMLRATEEHFKGVAG